MKSCGAVRWEERQLMDGNDLYREDKQRTCDFDERDVEQFRALALSAEVQRFISVKQKGGNILLAFLFVICCLFSLVLSF